MRPRARVVITGGAGFIGRRLVRSFAEDGWHVTVADRSPGLAGVPSVVGDLRDPAVARRAIAPDTDVVVHLAAATSVLRTIGDPTGTYEHNVDMTARLVELCRVRGVGTFLLASTNAVVGDAGGATISESTPLRPLTPYGATKAAAEALLSGYAAYGLTGCALRLGNVIGPGMREKDTLVPRLMRAARAGTGIQVYGDGTQVRDFVSVDDVVRGFRTALAARHVGPLVIGSGTATSVMELVAMVREVTGAAIPVHAAAPKAGEMPAVTLDISTARRLGYEPRRGLRSALTDTWAEFRDDPG